MEELGDELLDVAWVVQAAVPLLLDALEQTVWVVIFAALELDHPLRMLAHEETASCAGADEFVRAFEAWRQKAEATEVGVANVARPAQQ